MQHIQPETPAKTSSGWFAKKKQFLISSFTILIAGSVLGYLIYRQREVLLSYQWEIHWEYIIYSFLIYSVNLWLVAYIWANMMNSLGARLPFTQHLYYYCTANIAKRLPGTIWYIASRSQLYNTDKIPARVTTIASAIEFIIALLSSILIGIIFAWRLIFNYPFSLPLLIVLLVIFATLLHPRVLSRILKFLKIDSPIPNYWQVSFWFLSYLLAWIMAGTVVFSIGNLIYSLKGNHLPYIVGSMGILNLVTSALFFAPTNLGIGEITLSFLLSSIVPLPIAVVMAILVRLVLIIYEIIWAVIGIGLARR